MSTELHDLETHEVSLVPKGANGKNFLIFKSAKGKQGMKTAKEILDWVRKNSPEKMKEVEQVLKDMSEAAPEAGEHQKKPLSDKHKAGLQAIARIAGPMKDEIHPQHLVKVLQACGYDMSKCMAAPMEEAHKDDDGADAPVDKGSFKAIPEDILSDMKDVLKEKMNKGHFKPLEDDDDDDEDDGDEMDKAIKSHVKEASGAATKAYKEHMEKLGYRKYPDAEVTMKGIHKDLPKQVDVSEENHEHGEAQPMDKSVLKSLDLTKVDPKVKTALEAVFKSNQEIIAKNAKLETDLKSEREARRDKEFIEKAAKLNVGGKTEELAQILKALTDKDPKLAEAFEAQMKAAGEQIAKSKLFGEMGSERGGDGGGPGGDAWGKIEAMAKGLVEKSSEKITKEAAIAKVLESEEGKRLYNEYMGSKPGMKV